MKRSEMQSAAPLGWPSGSFSVVYADPPWRYDFCRSHRREIENHYPTMTRDEIAGLPVARLAAPDAVLVMWATWPKLDWALPVMEAWGFTFRTVAFVWVKTSSNGLAWGMGNWTRSNTEMALLGTRGSPKRASASVHQVVMAPRGRHSAKPAEVRDRIVRLMGDVPRVELFARERVQGWEAWGNEVEANH